MAKKVIFNPVHDEGLQLIEDVSAVDHAGLSNLTYATAGHTGFEPTKGADDNFVTDAQLVVIGNTSGTNTGDVTLASPNHGLGLTNQVITLGTPSTLTAITTNAVTTTTHTHAITGFATGAGSASGANTTDVSLAGTPNYLTLANQVITLTKLDPADDLNTFASSVLAGLLTDETGTDKVVFNTSPTFVTQITTPLIYGSSADNGDITIEGTSSATKTTSYVILQPTGGNVGIGTTAPGAKLDVYSGAALFRDRISLSQGSVLPFINTGTPGVWMSSKASDPSFFIGLSDTTDGAEKWGVYSNDNSWSLTVQTNGNVGIGTTGPNSALHVASGDIEVGNTNVNKNFKLNLGNGNDYWTFVPDGASGKNLSLQLGGTDTAGYLNISGGTGGGGLTTTGSVGIGTTGPDSLLEIAAAVVPTFSITNTDTSIVIPQTIGRIKWVTSDASVQGAGDVVYIDAIGVADFTGVYRGTDLTFWTSGSDSGASYNPLERVRITSLGLVGIGTTAPTTALHVLTANNVDTATFQINATSANITAADTFVRFTNSTDAEIGDISGTAVSGVIIYNTFTGGHYVQLRDEEEKIETGMIVVATGGIIPDTEGGVEYLPQITKSTKRKEKSVFGVFSGMAGRKCEGNHTTLTSKEGVSSEKRCDKCVDGLSHTCNFAKGDNAKDLYQVFGLGTGVILVTNTNGNIEVGDYICPSDIEGLGEKQDDDILHNYSVAKATMAVDWLLELKTVKLIPCSYHVS